MSVAKPFSSKGGKKGGPKKSSIINPNVLLSGKGIIWQPLY